MTGGSKKKTTHTHTGNVLQLLCQTAVVTERKNPFLGCVTFDGRA